MAILTSRMRQGLAVGMIGLALALAAAPAAHADDGQLRSYNAIETIAADGSVTVEAVLTFDGSAPATVRQVFDTTQRTTQSTEYLFDIRDVSVTTGTTKLNATVTSAPGTVTVEMPTAGVTSPITLSYTVVGAAVAKDGGTLVSWALLQGLSIPVQQFTAEVHAPGQFDQLDCAAGAPTSLGNCTYYAGGQDTQRVPSFRHDAIRAGDVVVVTLGFPAGTVAVNQNVRELWTIERAFSVAPLPLGVAVGLLLLGGLALFATHRRIGRDFAGAVEPKLIAEFTPVAAGATRFTVHEGVGPGAIGTLADQRVDPVDVTAAVLDLAVRGHLVITELPRESAYAPADWTFTRRSSSDRLAAYERTLLDAVAPVQGDPVKLSNLPGTLHAVIGDVQSQLYDEVVERGWFARRPDTTRDRWSLLGWVVLALAAAAAAVLIGFTSFGLLGLALVVIGLGLLFVAKEMPARTASGTAVLRGLEVLHGNLLTHPVENLGGKGSYVEISPLLPYAVVLGGRERWLQAMADSDDDDVPDSTDLDWYHGPEGWHLADLPASLTNFVTTVQGTLFSR